MTQQAGRSPVGGETAEFREHWPDLEYVEAFLTDINGIARGKRLPASALDRLYEKGLYLPASTTVLDVWGNEVEATGLVFETGDADLPCRPVAGSLRPLPWSHGRGAQVLLAMEKTDGSPWHADARNLLAEVSSRFHDRGQTPVVATELEFRLLDPDPDDDGQPRPVSCLQRSGGSQLFGVDELDAIGQVLADIDHACRAQDLPADTVIAEQSAGQYEVNLRHVANPLLAADHAVLLKRTIKSVARRHGMLASFMAKPFGDEAGNGLHVHASLLDAEGHNLFAGTDGPSSVLEHAVGGLTGTMLDAMALFAPHANSWRRFQEGTHVPLGPTWGFDNRTTAVRVPLSSAAATRIEHRVAGADANPYLVLAAVLGGIDRGLTGMLEPPPPTEGSAFERHARVFPATWEQALERFESSEFVAEYLGAEYRRLFTACKRQEQSRFRRTISRFELDSYLGTV